MGVSWKHVNCIYLITAHLKVEDFIRVDSSLLNESMSAYDNEELPLCVMPVLSLGDSWFADVDTYLSTIECMDKPL